ncbi:MAG: peptidylprolyl isomerase [Bacteroidetes bacterium]|nr:peptidylprolyl isomerase [Bacteroidota bacterium]
MTDFVKNGLVVGFNYTLKNDKGELVEKSQQPMEYLHGNHNIIPGLEKELDGMQVGDTKLVTVAPKDAYGEIDPEMVYEVPRKNFPAGVELTAGMQFQTETDGGMMVVTVKELKLDSIVVDGNSPMAGQTLHFDVSIASIRNATPQEVEHGHVHSHGHDH